MRYNREGLSYLNNDVVTTENYRVGIIVRVTARETATGRVLFDKARERLHPGSCRHGLADAERQSLPLLAEDLARNITESLTEGAW